MYNPYNYDNSNEYPVIATPQPVSSFSRLKDGAIVGIDIEEKVNFGIVDELFYGAPEDQVLQDLERAFKSIWSFSYHGRLLLNSDMFMESVPLYSKDDYFTCGQHHSTPQKPTEERLFEKIKCKRVQSLISKLRTLEAKDYENAMGTLYCNWYFAMNAPEVFDRAIRRIARFRHHPMLESIQDLENFFFKYAQTLSDEVVASRLVELLTIHHNTPTSQVEVKAYVNKCLLQMVHIKKLDWDNVLRVIVKLTMRCVDAWVDKFWNYPSFWSSELREILTAPAMITASNAFELFLQIQSRIDALPVTAEDSPAPSPDDGPSGRQLTEGYLSDDTPLIKLDPDRQKKTSFG
ncbi:hypothetical protein TRVA0_003S01706 [Trichomonascus vanleenenianus]|uniref:uncharacterized protein n=1 Tax=Trichomonascus vanleenenianus TaxID=2268995 RepID=UPI003ECB8A34